jgi:hypothetical protein
MQQGLLAQAANGSMQERRANGCAGCGSGEKGPSTYWTLYWQAHFALLFNGSVIQITFQATYSGRTLMAW